MESDYRELAKMAEIEERVSRRRKRQALIDFERKVTEERKNAEEIAVQFIKDQN